MSREKKKRALNSNYIIIVTTSKALVSNSFLLLLVRRLLLLAMHLSLERRRTEWCWGVDELPLALTYLLVEGPDCTNNLFF